MSNNMTLNPELVELATCGKKEETKKEDPKSSKEYFYMVVFQDMKKYYCVEPQHSGTEFLDGLRQPVVGTYYDAVVKKGEKRVRIRIIKEEAEGGFRIRQSIDYKGAFFEVVGPDEVRRYLND